MADDQAKPPEKPGENAPTALIRPPAPQPATPRPPVWRGAAGVTAPDPNADRTAAFSPQEPSGRAWWWPVVLGIVGVLILIAIVYVLVRALNNSGASTPAVTSSPSAAASAPPGTSSVLPSVVPSAPLSQPASVPPSPIAPSPSVAASVAGASTVVLPTTLTGLLSPDVEAELNALGLHYTLQPQIVTDPSVLPNTVLSIVPAGGTTVATGSTVVIVFAAPPGAPSS